MSTGTTWVRVGVHTALISYPLRARRGQPLVPTWLVLGPLREDKRPRATVAAGYVSVDGAQVRLVVKDGELPAELAPALLEAAQSMVARRAVHA